MKTKKNTLFLKISTYIAWAIVAVILVWNLKSLWHYWHNETTNDAQVFEYINPVIARVGGYIKEVKYNDYDYVTKGDTLFIIDAQEYHLDAGQVEGDVMRQNAMSGVLDQRVRTLQEEADEYKNAIDAAKAQVWKQQLEYDRYQQLFDKQSATAQQLESVKANLEVNKSELARIEQHYKVALSKIDDVYKEKNVVNADQKKYQDLYARKNVDVGYTVVRAPYNGRMGKRKTEVGQMINAGDHLGYIVNDETPKWVIANFKETQIKNIALQDTVTIIADAYPDLTYKAKVVAFSPATGSSFALLPPDNATGNFVKIVQRIPVKLEIIEADQAALNLLLSGMNVTVSVPTK